MNRRKIAKMFRFMKLNEEMCIYTFIYRESDCWDYSWTKMAKL